MTTPDPRSRRVGRRALLTGSAGVVGLAAGAGGVELLAPHGDSTAPVSSTPPTEDAARLAPADHRTTGRNLPTGLPDRVPAFGTLLTFDLTPQARRTPDRARAAAIAFLQFAGRLADQAGDPAADGPRDTGAAGLDLRPASLQITPGVGATLLDACRLRHQRPAAFVDLPAFAADRLDPTLSGGDLMVQVGAEDPLRMSAAIQELTSFVRSHLADDLAPRWSRAGFRNTAAGSHDPATTSRNLMGHRDGTNNPALGSPLWRFTVQVRRPGWMEGGSYLVARQILIGLDEWFTHPETARDRVIGRRTSDGAALGEPREQQPVDLSARTSSGHLVIPADAHIRLASAQNTHGARIYRRSWSFDDGYAGGRRRAGLLFLAWQADIRQGFLPIQRVLADHGDALNRFTTHIGSAAFAVPARGDDQYVGQRLLEG